MLFDIGCTIGLVVSQRYQADARRQRGIQSDHGLRSARGLGYRGSRGVSAKGEGEGFWAEFRRASVFTRISVELHADTV